MRKKTVAKLHVALTFKTGSVAARCATAASVATMCPTSALYMNDAAVKAAADNLKQEGLTLAKDEQDAEDARKVWIAALTKRDAQIVAFDQTAQVLKTAVERGAKQPADIQSMGLLALQKSVTVPLSKVLNFTVKPAKAKGFILAHARVITGLRQYKMQISQDPITPTSFADLEGWHARRKLGGLVSGARYWLRACAMRGALLGEWSDPVAVVVP